jgi:ATP-dependent Lon protease
MCAPGWHLFKLLYLNIEVRTYIIIVLTVEKQVNRLARGIRTIPLVPLRGLTLFPQMVLNFDVGRDKSLAALDYAMESDQILMLAAQKNAETEDPGPDDIYEVGTVAHIKQLIRLPGDTVRIIVEGLYRGRIMDFTREDPYAEVLVAVDAADSRASGPDLDALARGLQELFEEFAGLSGRVSPETLIAVAALKDASEMADTIAAAVLKKSEDKQALLETYDTLERLEKLHVILTKELEIQKIEKRINMRVKQQVDQNQKEYYLHEQIKAIQSELGQDDASENDELARRVDALPMNDEAREKAKKELTRLQRMTPGSPETPVIRTYIDWLLDMPWGTETEDNMDLANAEKILNEDHYGLDKVKERIVEYLAVRRLTDTMRGPILCFVGPPGVGKTSVARSIARALGRKFVRMSLGGVRDEAEIRGHRRTYIGAIPGRIISSIKTAGTKNPVFLFDEVDKLGNDFRGDPASALLEVLDPEQNCAFRDHYMEVPFDLSRVMFLATANTLDTVPPALMDRMEVIYLPGYTDEEKANIARRHLLPKQLKEHGLKDTSVSITDETIKFVIGHYTREAGVRNLEREIANMCRKCARQIAEHGKTRLRVTPSNAEKYFGNIKYKREDKEHHDEVGVATGLAWTAFGGETLAVEVNTMPGTGKLELTGQLGEVMKESARAALSYVRSHAEKLGVDPEFHNKLDIHVHVPEGAIPKDGPSAGITLATAITSALTGRPVSGEIAMTGEITLRGRVLPIGGLKEKSLAAYREGLTTILVPQGNQPDIREIPDNIRRKLKLIPVKTLDDVLKHALLSGK